MNRTTRIISKVLLIVGALALAGCKITTPDWGKYRGTNPHPHVVINNKPISHDELNGDLEQIEQEAKHLDMSVVNYLHQVNANKIERVTAHDLLPDPFYANELNYLLVKMNEAGNVNYIKDFVLYQAWDHQHPNVSPAFAIKEEAQEYADGNNNSDGIPTGHKYVVREINYRYEVRVGFSDYTYSNGTWKDLIFTSASLKESEKYLNEYKTNRTDLHIFDLMTSAVVGVNTP